MSGEFPIGFWNHHSIIGRDISEVTRWKECGVNLPHSFIFSYDNCKKEDLIAFLDECERQDIKMILNIRGMEYRDCSSEEEYRSLFERAYNDFGRHPATYGFAIGDEPMDKAGFDDCAKVIRIQKEIAPELRPFINFCPWNEEYEEKILGDNMIDWARSFSEASKIDQLCYDCYSQMNPNLPRPDHYFANLRLYREAAEAAGTELWYCPLSVAHFCYYMPTEDNMRWQLHTAAASGVRGIVWFIFYNIMPCNNFRNSPIDEFGKETETYHAMARVHKRFHAMYGDLLYRLKFRKVYHFEECYGGVEEFPENTHPFIRRMISEDRLPGILSFFEDENGKEYCVLVNNSFERNCRFHFELNKNVKKICRTAMNGTWMTDFAKSHWDAFYEEHEDCIRAGVWLAPGQMEIFCFE